MSTTNSKLGITINKLPTFSQLNRTSALIGASITTSPQILNFTHGLSSNTSLIYHDVSTDSITIGLDNAGYYELNFSVSYALDTADVVDFLVYINSFADEYMASRTYNEASSTPATNYYVNSSKSFFYNLSAGDIITLKYKSATSTSSTIDIRGAVLTVKKLS